MDQILDAKHQKPGAGDVRAAIEVDALRPPAHGVEAQQELPQQLPGIEGAVLPVIVLVGVLQDGIQILGNGPVPRFQGGEVRLVRDAPLPVQPLQHQLQGVHLLVGEGLVGPEEVLEEGDVLGQGGFLPECRGCV